MISSNMELHQLSTGRMPRVVTAMTMLKQYLFRHVSYRTLAMLYSFANTTRTYIDTKVTSALRSSGSSDAAVATAQDQLAAASTQVSAVQASLGARAARVELDQASLKQADTDRETTRSELEDTDITTAVTELQKTMTVLQATQASFTKLSSMSLFDYLK